MTTERLRHLLTLDGLGGDRLTELLDTAEALRMVAETHASKVLAGLRGAPPADIQALAQALSDLSRYVAAHAPWLESLEANPVLVRPAGQGLVALDAVLIGRQPG